LLEIGLITVEELGHHFSSQELDDGSYNYYYFFFESLLSLGAA
jgi:hypothetical protein